MGDLLGTPLGGEVSIWAVGLLCFWLGTASPDLIAVMKVNVVNNSKMFVNRTMPVTM